MSSEWMYLSVKGEEDKIEAAPEYFSASFIHKLIWSVESARCHVERMGV